MIINDDSRVINKLETTITDDANVVIYDCHMIIVPATGIKSHNLYLNVDHFSTPVLIRHLWQLETIVFLHWCLICTIVGDDEIRLKRFPPVGPL
jgi:hypothetical protein